MGTEMKNVACSRFRKMLHLEIQKGKEAMNMSKFQKGYGKLTSNDTHFADIWFSYVKTAEDMAAAGVDYCGPAKTIHKSFF